MFFRSLQECQEAVRFQGLDPADLDDRIATFRRGDVVRGTYEDSSVTPYVLARDLVSWLGDFSSCLLWITEFGIWPSSENLHLYYRLRQSYGEFRHLYAAPGHDFLRHETSDLISFASLAIEFRWGGHFICPGVDPYLFISHDGWFHLDSTLGYDEVIERLEIRNIPWHRHGADQASNIQ